MVKGTTRQTIAAAALHALLLLLCLSCSDDDTSLLSYGDASTVSIGMTIRATYGYDDAYYETGSTYENYIDVAGGDYRIYFFESTADDGNDKLIATFTPESVLPVEGSDYTEYTVLGKVPEDVTSLTNFKVVMLANWGNYPTVETGTTTIEAICTDEASQYTHLENFELSPSNDSKRLIPFYGVHTYTDIAFKVNQATILHDPITLLRAMAKVEVVFEPNDDDYANSVTSFKSVRVHRYNNKGYCAPAKVYKQEEYDSGYQSWSTDFVSELHLVGDGNDGNGTPQEKTLEFLKTQEYADNGEAVTACETWTAYLPEYSNTTDDDDYTYLEVLLDDDTSYNIYFAEYTNGKTNAYDEGNNDYTGRYDIKRNTLYRFTVSVALGDPTLNVHVNKWDEVYENKYEFGTSE